MGTAGVRIVLAGVLAYPVVVLMLVKATALGVLDSFFLAGLVQLLPTLALGQIVLARGVVIERVPAYLNSGSSILLLGASGLFMGQGLVGLSGLGLEAPWSVANLIWTGVLVVVGIGTLLVFLVVRRVLQIEETELVHELMPVTGKEKSLFSVLSLCAGFGEEMAYRGYAISALVVATGSATFALVLTSATFGVLHAYQGPIGVARTGVIGLIMGGAFLYTGSLWPPIVAHALIDLMVGLVLKVRLLS